MPAGRDSLEPAGADQDRPVKGAWLWLGLLIAIALSSSLSAYCVDGLVDPIKRSLHFSDVQISFILGWAYVGVYALVSLPAGGLVDRGPRRLILMAGALMWGSGAVCCALAQSFPAFCIGRAMVGLGQAALGPASMSILADSFPTRLRARVFGAAMAAWGVGPGIGLTVSGIFLSVFSHGAGPQPFAWRPTILCCAAPAFVLGLSLLLMSEPPRERRAERAARAYGGARFWGPLAVTLLAIAAVTISDGAQLSWSVAALVREHAVAPAAAARYAGYVFFFCGAAAPLVAGSLADLLYRAHGIPGRLLVAIVAIAALIPLQCLYGGGSASHLLMVLVGTGFTVVTGEVVGAAVLQDIVPDNRRGLAAAANGLCSSIAIGIGTTGVAMTAHYRAASTHPTSEAMSLTTVPASALALLVFLALWLAVKRAAAPQASSASISGPIQGA
jgi:MFS family permease